LGDVQLNLSSTKLKSLAVSISSFQSEIEKVVVTAYAAALTRAHNNVKKNGCLVFLNEGGCVWIPDFFGDPRTSCGDRCFAVAYSEGAVESRDIVTEAGVLLFSLRLIGCTP
jgi:hypothetical protein